MEAAIQQSGECMPDKNVQDIISANGVREIKGPDSVPFLSDERHNELRLLWCLSIDFSTHITTR